jgi:hypothetical protein
MKAAQLKREIEVVENLINQLNKCLAIYHKEKMYEEFRVTLVDIQICRKELHKLMAAKKAEMEAEKGAATNVSHFERSGENVSQ